MGYSMVVAAVLSVTFLKDGENKALVSFNGHLLCRLNSANYDMYGLN